MKKVLHCDDFYFHNEYFDMVAAEPDNYDLNVVMDVSFLSITHRKKLLDYLFKTLILISYNDILLFRAQLIDYDMYNDYVKSIKEGNDNFLKACLILYLENDLKDELFKDNMDIVNTIINSNEEKQLQLSNLLNVSQFKCDEDTFNCIKDNFKNILLEFNKDEDIGKNSELLAHYYELMDNNQINLGNSKVLKKEN